MPISSIGLKENIDFNSKWSISDYHDCNHKPGGGYGVCKDSGYTGYNDKSSAIPSGQIGYTNIVPLWNQWFEAGQCTDSQVSASTHAGNQVGDGYTMSFWWCVPRNNSISRDKTWWEGQDDYNFNGGNLPNHYSKRREVFYGSMWTPHDCYTDDGDWSYRPNYSWKTTPHTDASPTGHQNPFAKLDLRPDGENDREGLGMSFGVSFEYIENGLADRKLTESPGPNAYYRYSDVGGKPMFYNTNIYEPNLGLACKPKIWFGSHYIEPFKYRTSTNRDDANYVINKFISTEADTKYYGTNPETGDWSYANDGWIQWHGLTATNAWRSGGESTQVYDTSAMATAGIDSMWDLVSPNVWHHCVLSTDGDDIDLWMDGNHVFHSEQDLQWGLHASQYPSNWDKFGGITYTGGSGPKFDSFIPSPITMGMPLRGDNPEKSANKGWNGMNSCNGVETDIDYTWAGYNRLVGRNALAFERTDVYFSGSFSTGNPVNNHYTELTTWNDYLTDAEVVALYNDGKGKSPLENSASGGYQSASSVEHYIPIKNHGERNGINVGLYQNYRYMQKYPHENQIKDDGTKREPGTGGRYPQAPIHFFNTFLTGSQWIGPAGINEYTPLDEMGIGIHSKSTTRPYTSWVGYGAENESHTTSFSNGAYFAQEKDTASYMTNAGNWYYGAMALYGACNPLITDHPDVADKAYKKADGTPKYAQVMRDGSLEDIEQVFDTQDWTQLGMPSMGGSITSKKMYNPLGRGAIFFASDEPFDVDCFNDDRYPTNTSVPHGADDVGSYHASVKKVNHYGRMDTSDVTDNWGNTIKNGGGYPARQIYQDDEYLSDDPNAQSSHHTGYDWKFNILDNAN